MAQSNGSTGDALERLVGSTVASKYRIDRLLGRGGMGAVFQATNVALNKRVALKFLSEEAARDEQAALRFQREAEAASLVESEHIVQTFDFGATEQGLPFLVMELLSGQDLRAKLKQQPKLGQDEALGIALQIVTALVPAHAAGIVHRDLKPDNVFLCERPGAEPRVKIVDFGISKLSRHATLNTLTQRGTILGTAFYMSPEQAQGLEEVDPRADLYSVGAILYEMLAGRPPHTAPTYEAVLVAICTRDAEDVRRHAHDTSETVSRLLRKSLARDREHRFQSASEMKAALEAALAGRRDPSLDSAALAVPIRPSVVGARLARRRTWVAALVALLFGFAATALVLARGQQRPTSEGAEPLLPSSTALPQATVEPRAPAVAPPATVPAALLVAPPPSATSSSARPKAAPATSRKRTEASAVAPAGVAGSLKLNTSGP